MDNIFEGIQHFFIAVVATVTAFVLTISPFKPDVHPTPTPTPVEVYENQEATPSSTPAAEVKGINPKENKANTTPRPETPKPTPTINSTPTSSVNSVYQSPVNLQQLQPGKKDYSSYRTALQATLDSLKNRLYTIQTQADQTPQDVDSQINSINTRLASDLLTLENVYNQSTTNLSREFGFRGIPLSSGLFQAELKSLTDNYNSSRNSLISQADQEKRQVFANAENKVYQADAQDKDLSNKIKVVEGLINKIISGTFTDSDIPLAIQAIYY